MRAFSGMAARAEGSWSRPIVAKTLTGSSSKALSTRRKTSRSLFEKVPSVK